jgi:hypothetical protein
MREQGMLRPSMDIFQEDMKGEDEQAIPFASTKTDDDKYENGLKLQKEKEREEREKLKKILIQDIESIQQIEKDFFDFNFQNETLETELILKRNTSIFLSSLYIKIIQYFNKLRYLVYKNYQDSFFESYVLDFLKIEKKDEDYFQLLLFPMCNNIKKKQVSVLDLKKYSRNFWYDEEEYSKTKNEEKNFLENADKYLQIAKFDEKKLNDLIQDKIDELSKNKDKNLNEISKRTLNFLTVIKEQYNIDQQQ